MEKETAVNITQLKSIIKKEISEHYAARHNNAVAYRNVELLDSILDILNGDPLSIYESIPALECFYPIFYSQSDTHKFIDNIRDLTIGYKIKPESITPERDKYINGQLDTIYKAVYNFKNEYIKKLDESRKKIDSEDNIRYISKLKFIYDDISNNGYIDKNTGVDALFRLGKKYNISDKNLVIIIETVKRNSFETQGKKYYSSLLDVLKVKDYPFFDISVIDDSNNKEEHNTQIEFLTENIMLEGFNKTISVFPDVSRLDEDAFDYIYKSVLNNLNRELLTYKAELVSHEVYKDKELSKMYMGEYNKLNDDYRALYTYYIKTKSDVFKTVIEEVEETTEEREVQNNLIYLQRSSDDSTYFEKDLKSIPADSYDDVITMINNFKYGNGKNKIKTFNNNENLNGFRELKLSDIRIMLKNISDNYYLVLGCFQKKQNSELKKTENIANRYKDIDLEYYLGVNAENEERIMNILQSAKGGRTK